MDAVPPLTGSRPQVRPASRQELRRMAPHVLWFYLRGQPVILWVSSLRLTLTPFSVPAGEVVVLQQASKDQAAQPR